MRQVLLCVSILLLGLTWGFAQTSGSSDATPSQSGSTGQMGHAGSGHTTVEGCLSGSNGNYTLTDKQGNTYQLTGDTAKLSEHVGHEVKIMGSESGGETAGGTASSSTGAGASHTLQVSSAKHISKSCQSGTGGAMTH